MSLTRIYVVLNRTTGEKRLVEATSQSSAIRHCVTPHYKADVATPKAVASCIGEGLKVEVATQETKQTAQS